MHLRIVDDANVADADAVVLARCKTVEPTHIGNAGNAVDGNTALPRCVRTSTFVAELRGQNQAVGEGRYVLGQHLRRAGA